MRTPLTLLLGIAAAAVLMLAPGGNSTPVASLPQLYQVCGRVFPDPHAYWPAPAQAPGRSPWAKGNAVCAASDFMQYQEMIDGVTYLQQLFPRFVTFIKLNEQFGTRVPCVYSTSSQDMCSAGLPTTTAANGDVREKQELYMIRVSDGPSNVKKKLFAFPLSIHGIERAGAEAGARMAEDLATWGYCEAVQKGELASNGITNCAQEGAIPHRLLEADPGAQSATAGDALKKSAIYFIFANPDGWRRGDRDNPAHSYQRYNGNGVDLNRDWPTLGFTFRPYTPWSEPETRSFGKALKKIASSWAGGIDLHGQLIDRAFSFTLMGASERNYAKNQRILQVVKGAWADAEARLIWSPMIKPNDAPSTCVNPAYAICDRVYGVQWGTVWDTIDYTVTGAFGDWIDSPMGLNGDGIDNEMSLSHLSNCGLGTCYLADAEQLHVDGNKSLVYSHVNYTLLPEDARFRLSGKAAYVRDPAVISNPGSPAGPPPANKLPQAPIMDVLLSPANSYSYEFDVKGPSQGSYNGGLEGKVTWTNAGGVSPTGSGVTSVVLERKLAPGEEPEPASSACDGQEGWLEVNRYFNQGIASAPYVQAGGAVHSNLPLPGHWRICFLSNVELAGGAADLDITFSREKAWDDPGQKPYSVTNMKFFDDLRNASGPLRPLGPVTPEAVLDGTANLGTYNSLIVADNPAPGVADTAAWAARLREFVETGGNLILTDKALKNLEYMGIVAAGKVTKRTEYAGWIGFTTTGSDETYTDPLAANIDQPGAAEGAGHRHQTYEPVPIGYTIQNANGDDANSSPVWVVDKTAWQGAGGRTVGTTGSNSLVSLGELALGKGKIRIIGALVPMPTEAFDHPFGLANYAVTYTGYQLVYNALQYTRPVGN